MREGFTVEGVIGRIGLLGALVLLGLIVLFELALFGVVFVIIWLGRDDIITSLIIAAGVFIVGQILVGLLLWIASVVVRLIAWILLGPEVSYVGGTIDSTPPEGLGELGPEERLRWANREGEFADPVVTPSDILKRRPHAVHLLKDIERLEPAEKLRWANQQGEFADPVNEPKERRR